MTTNRLGKHQAAMVAFAREYPGPHSLTGNRYDPSHRALASLSTRGLMVRSTVGRQVYFELPSEARKTA